MSKQHSSTTWVIAGITVAVLALFGVVLVSVMGSNDGAADETASVGQEPAEEVDQGDEGGAVAACRRFVEDRLKSPSTADFDLGSVEQVRGPVWEVGGTVDSENSFGAEIRNDYECRMRYAGDDEWRLVDLIGLTN